MATRLACSADELWQKITDPVSLQFEASPVLSFVPVEAGGFTGEWQVGVPYPLGLYFLKFICGADLSGRMLAAAQGIIARVAAWAWRDYVQLRVSSRWCW
jgi:hypothetical protein